MCQRDPTAPNVYDLIPPELRGYDGLSCFGRLDRDTTGMLMFGTDGGVQSPTTVVPALWLCTVAQCSHCTFALLYVCTHCTFALTVPLHYCGSALYLRTALLHSTSALWLCCVPLRCGSAVPAHCTSALFLLCSLALSTAFHPTAPHHTAPNRAVPRRTWSQSAASHSTTVSAMTCASHTFPVCKVLARLADFFTAAHNWIDRDIHT